MRLRHESIQSVCMLKVNFTTSLICLFTSVVLTSCSIIQENPGSVSPDSTTLTKEEKFRHELVAFAKEHVGTRYHYAGKDPRGFDCSGFTYYVMNKFDIDLPPSSKHQEDEGRSVSVKEVQTGDLVFFRRVKVGKPFHVALVVSNNRDGLKVIHSTSRGVVIDNVSESSYWKPKISSARDVISSNI